MLFNDEVHTYEQVIYTLQKAVNCTQKEAVSFATVVDRDVSRDGYRNSVLNRSQGLNYEKPGVSISSDVNGSAVGTGEINKTHIHLLLLYIHIVLQILSHQRCQLFLYAIIFNNLSMMHIRNSEARSRSRGGASARATWKPFLIMIEERIIQTSAYILGLWLLITFIKKLIILRIIAVFLLAQLLLPFTSVRIRSSLIKT